MAADFTPSSESTGEPVPAPPDGPDVGVSPLPDVEPEIRLQARLAPTMMLSARSILLLDGNLTALLPWCLDFAG